MRIKVGSNQCIEVENGIEKIETLSSQRKNSIGGTQRKLRSNIRVFYLITPTPGGNLLREVERREAELNRNSKERKKIVEKGGIKRRDMLGTKNIGKVML